MVAAIRLPEDSASPAFEVPWPYPARHFLGGGLFICSDLAESISLASGMMGNPTIACGTYAASSPWIVGVTSHPRAAASVSQFCFCGEDVSSPAALRCRLPNSTGSARTPNSATVEGPRHRRGRLVGSRCRCALLRRPRPCRCNQDYIWRLPNITRNQPQLPPRLIPPQLVRSYSSYTINVRLGNI